MQHSVRDSRMKPPQDSNSAETHTIPLPRGLSEQVKEDNSSHVTSHLLWKGIVGVS